MSKPNLFLWSVISGVAVSMVTLLANFQDHMHPSCFSVGLGFSLCFYFGYRKLLSKGSPESNSTKALTRMKALICMAVFYGLISTGIGVLVALANIQSWVSGWIGYALVAVSGALGFGLGVRIAQQDAKKSLAADGGNAPGPN